MSDGRQVPKEIVRNIYLLRLTPAVFAVILTWLFYVVAAVWHFDLLDFVRFRPQPKKVDAEHLFYIALVTTIVAPVLAAWYIRKALYFAQYGIPVNAIVRSVGMVKAAGGMFDITYDYEFRGRTFSGKASVVEIDKANKKYVPGAELVVLVHPRRPSESKLWDDVIVHSQNADADDTT